jgi:hypothetical protein
MTRDFKNVEWWNEKAKKHGRTAAASGYSEWSTPKRFGAVAKHLGARDRVADMFAGVGLLEMTHGPFERYVAFDFAESALKQARADLHVRYTMPEDFGMALSVCKEEKIDWIVFCGGFMFELVIGERNPVDFVREAFKVARVGVIANFASSHVEHESDLLSYDAMDVCNQLRDLRPSLDQSYLPHEFMICVQHPKKDWK